MIVSVDGLVQPEISISITVPAYEYAVNASVQVITVSDTEKAAVGVEELIVQPVLQVMTYVFVVVIAEGMVSLNPWVEG